MLEQTKLPLLFILSLITSYLCQVQLQSNDFTTGVDCTTPDGEDGTCISLMDCQSLLTLVQKSDRTTKELQMLRQSQCGVSGNRIKVCCAINDTRCYNPDGNLGLCVGVTECPAITKLLQPPISTENLNFIRNSRCESPARYSVCCGPDHVSNVPASRICEPSSAPPDPRTECCGLESSSGNKIIGKIHIHKDYFDAFFRPDLIQHTLVLYITLSFFTTHLCNKYRDRFYEAVMKNFTTSEGGSEVAIDQYPWLTLIEYRAKKDNQIKLLCGGALISSKYVLTAGHCVAGPVLNVGKPVNIRLGEYDTSNSGPDCVMASGGGQDCTSELVIIPIQKVIPHREYDPVSSLRRNDIALIRMTDNAPFTDFIRPICLPTSDITLTNQNVVLYAAGWGAVSLSESFSNIKLYVDLPYKPLEQCQAAYNVSSRKLKLWKGQICAGGESGKDTCRGDSGGPLIYDDGRIFSVLGVVSFGPTPCALKDVPGVYTKVFEYIPWIRSNIRP